MRRMLVASRAVRNLAASQRHPLGEQAIKRTFAAAHFGRYWHKASLRGTAANGRFRGQSGHRHVGRFRHKRPACRPSASPLLPWLDDLRPLQAAIRIADEVEIEACLPHCLPHHQNWKPPRLEILPKLLISLGAPVGIKLRTLMLLKFH